MNFWFWELKRLNIDADYALVLLFNNTKSNLPIAERYMVAPYVRSEAQSRISPRRTEVYIHPENDLDISNTIEVEDGDDAIFIWRSKGGILQGAEAELRFALQILLNEREKVVEWRIYDAGVYSIVDRRGITIEDFLAYLGMSWTECEMLLR